MLVVSVVAVGDDVDGDGGGCCCNNDVDILRHITGHEALKKSGFRLDQLYHDPYTDTDVADDDTQKLQEEMDNMGGMYCNFVIDIFESTSTTLTHH